MKKFFSLMFIILYCNYSYSQMFNIEERTKENIRNIEIEQDMTCMDISAYDYPFISLYMCVPNNMQKTYSSFVTDSVVILEFIIHFHFTDTISYFIINNIQELSQVNISTCSGEVLPEKYFEKIVKDIFSSSNFYYIQKGVLQDFSHYFTLPIRITPQILPCD